MTRPTPGDAVKETAVTDLAAAELEWQHWIADACAAVGVDPADVDIAGIHGLTKEIAHGFARPMAPVGSFILGLAVGARAGEGHDVSQVELVSAIRSTFPGPPA